MSRIDAQRAAIIAVLNREPGLCWDCPTASFHVRFDGRRFVVTVSHWPTCPARRSEWSARCASDHVRAVLLLAGLPLAGHLDVSAVHRKQARP